MQQITGVKHIKIQESARGSPSRHKPEKIHGGQHDKKAEPHTMQDLFYKKEEDEMGIDVDIYEDNDVESDVIDIADNKNDIKKDRVAANSNRMKRNQHAKDADESSHVNDSKKPSPNGSKKNSLLNN